MEPGYVQGKRGKQGQQRVYDHHRQIPLHPSIESKGAQAHQTKQARAGDDRQLGVITQAAPDIVHVQIRILFLRLGYLEPEPHTMAEGHCIYRASAVSRMRLTMARRPLPRVTLRCLSRFSRAK